MSSNGKLVLDDPMLPKAASASASASSGRRVTISVGGQVFETTLATLQSGGHGSLLARSAAPLPTQEQQRPQIFFDRDPATFRILLNLLRTRRLPASFDKDALIDEASFYGLLRIVNEAMAPDALNGIDLERTTNLLPTGRDFPSALCASADGSLLISHGSKITAFDWALRKLRTTLTEFNTIDSLHRLSDSHVACGSGDLPGLHIYDAVRGVHAKSVIWTDKNDTRVYNPSVRAIDSNSTTLFASFENDIRLENTVVLIDRVTLQVAGEVGRQNGNSAHSKVATKLQWLPNTNLLMTAGIHGGTFGWTGYIRLWDMRQSVEPVWELKEPNIQGVDPRLVERDCFADIAVDEEHAGIFKVNIESGNVAMADMRHLKAEDPWMTLTEVNPNMAVKGKCTNSKLLCYNKQIYCSRGGDLEVWSEVPLAGTQVDLAEREYWETSFRRNFVEHRRHGSHDITYLDAGGQRLFVARKEMQGVEVWETRKMSF